MTANLLFELKKTFYSFLPDIIAVNLILVFVLFSIFFIIHLFKKRRRYVDDTVPYVVYLKENIEQLVEEAEVLRKKLESTRYKNINENYKTNKSNKDETSSEDEIERYQSLIEEKDSEISVLKEELSKYEKNQNSSKDSDAEKSSNNKDLSFTIEILKNENKELKEKLEEVSLIGADTKQGSEEELRKHNLELSLKLEELKKQLTEYEIIEDELSELKTLKEENFNLKEKQKGLGSADIISEVFKNKPVEEFLEKEEEISLSLEDIEKDFQDLTSINEAASNEDEIKSQIEKEIDEELNRELEDIETKEKNKEPSLQEKTTAISTLKVETSIDRPKEQVNEKNIDFETETQKELETNDDDLDLELVGLPSDEDSLIEAEIQRLDSELEKELKNSEQELIENKTLEKEISLKEENLSEVSFLKETEKNSDNNEDAVKIETDANIQDPDKALAEEFEKFLSES